MDEVKTNQKNVLARQTSGKITPGENTLHMLNDQSDPIRRRRPLSQQAIRTYESDMADLLGKKETTVATIAIAEQKRKEEIKNTIVRQPVTPVATPYKPVQKNDVPINSRIYTPPTRIKVESPAIVPEKQNKIEEYAPDKYDEDAALSDESVIETKQAPILSNLISAEDFTNPEPVREAPILKMDTFVESMNKPIIRKNDVQPTKENVSIKPHQARTEKLSTPEPIREAADIKPEPIVERVIEPIVIEPVVEHESVIETIARPIAIEPVVETTPVEKTEKLSTPEPIAEPIIIEPVVKIEPVAETVVEPIPAEKIEELFTPEPIREATVLEPEPVIETIARPIAIEPVVKPIPAEKTEELFTPEPIREAADIKPEPIVERVIEPIVIEPVIKIEPVAEASHRPAPAPFNFPRYTPPVQVKNSSLQIEDKEDTSPEFIDNSSSKKEASVFVPKKTFTTITDESAGTGNYSRKIFMVIVSIILIVGGVGAGYYLYLKSPLAKPTVVPISTSKVPSIIKPETQKIVPIGNLKGVSLQEKIRSVVASDAVAAGALNEVVLTQTTGSSTIRVTALNFIKTIGYQTPEIFKRSLMNTWMLGAYGSDGGNAPFIIFKTDFFQNSYAGMLDWEKNMVDDLAIILNFEEKIKNQNNSGTTTTRGYLAVRGKFEDKIILNRDVRRFTNENGVSLLVYSFIDKDTLVITTSETVLKNIIQKLEKQTQIR